MANDSTLVTFLSTRGVWVLAKTDRDGGLWAYTFANLTQAQRRADMVPGAFVRRFGRPFFVVVPDADAK